ncbi:unnamed protein product [Prorocentrum cordatum]|uniref:Uncharacterized protein n=1 Tax=Prorocentrum cordatum TaxID=2364126 RepID=A0ABN9VUT0_9DINO|nr:unnamed protein product [Polarella glacialis]
MGGGRPSQSDIASSDPAGTAASAAARPTEPAGAASRRAKNLCSWRAFSCEKNITARLPRDPPPPDNGGPLSPWSRAATPPAPPPPPPPARRGRRGQPRGTPRAPAAYQQGIGEEPRVRAAGTPAPSRAELPRARPRG